MSHIPIIVLIYHADSDPYGTPNSLTLVGPQESLPSSEIDLSAIPDSPIGRESTSARGAFVGPMRLDRESTKSESPELRVSVHEVPPADSIDASVEHPVASAISPESSMITSALKSASQPVSVLENIDEHTKDHDFNLEKESEKVADINRPPKPRAMGPAYPQIVQNQSNTVRELDPVFDPIESDTESFHEKQQMQSVKRLRSSKTPTASFKSFRASSMEGMNRRDGQFLVPPLPPQSRMNGPRKSSSETPNSGQHEDVSMPRRDSNDADTGIQNDIDRHGTLTTETDEDAQSMICHSDPLDPAQETPKGKTAGNKVVDANLTSSQAVTTAWPQDINTSANNTGKAIDYKRDNSASSHSQEPDEPCFGHDVDAVVTNPEDSRSAPGTERPGREVEEHKAKIAVEQRKDEQQDPLPKTMGKGKVAVRKPAELRAEDEKSLGRKGAKEINVRPEESAQAKKTKAVQRKVAQAKRIEETRANEKRERQIREASLAEEANKAMLAADGAKQIEAEMLEKEKARHKELEAKKLANEVKADEQARTARGKAQGKKAREAQRAREKGQKLADSECNEAKEQVLPTRTARETATVVREKAQKRIADREAQKYADPKRSMTPRIPGSSVTRSSPIMNSLRSSPQSNRSSGNMDAPLRSALRQTSSRLGRSVSSVSFDVPQRANTNEHMGSTPNSKSPKLVNKEVATKASSATELPKSPLRTTSSPPLKRPVKTNISKKISDGKATKTSAKHEKVQTKLNVTRESKKLKGRAYVPPNKPPQTPKQEIVISSGEDSSPSDDPVWQTGNAQAGPSSRKPKLPAVSQIRKNMEAQPSGVPIDPSIRSIKIEKDGTAASAALPRRSSTLDTASVKPSTSRSPALVLSETISLSSGSASSTTSESDLESDSEEELEAPSSQTPTDTKIKIRASGTMTGVSKAANIGVKQPETHLKGKAHSQSISQFPSSRSNSTVATKGDSEHIDQAANKQLQSDTRDSIPSSRVSRASSSINGAVSDKMINQGLDHAGRLPNGIRPAYYTYPTLSEIKTVPRADTSKAEPRRNTISTQPVGASPAGPVGSDSSSSDSDEHSSNSDEDDDAGGPPVPTTSTKPFPGLRGLTKGRFSRLC